jgi:hypothetical protein
MLGGRTSIFLLLSVPIVFVSQLVLAYQINSSLPSEASSDARIVNTVLGVAGALDGSGAVAVPGRPIPQSSGPEAFTLSNNAFRISGQTAIGEIALGRDVSPGITFEPFFFTGNLATTNPRQQVVRIVGVAGSSQLVDETRDTGRNFFDDLDHLDQRSSASVANAGLRYSVGASALALPAVLIVVQRRRRSRADTAPPESASNARKSGDGVSRPIVQQQIPDRIPLPSGQKTQWIQPTKPKCGRSVHVIHALTKRGNAVPVFLSAQENLSREIVCIPHVNPPRDVETDNAGDCSDESSYQCAIN